MKKIFITLLAGVSFFPLTASADLVGTGTMVVTGKGGTATVSYPQISSGNWVTAKLDYEASSVTIGAFAPANGYAALQLDTVEVYCVEGALLQSGIQNYEFYTYENSLQPYYSEDTWNKVTWLANYGLTNNAAKELVQKTVWELLVVGDVKEWIYLSNSSAYTDYLDASNKAAYADDWMLAVTPLRSLGQIAASQNYLVKATATPDPVPEPTTMLLFGTGIAGLAGIARRKRD